MNQKVNKDTQCIKIEYGSRPYAVCDRIVDLHVQWTKSSCKSQYPDFNATDLGVKQWRNQSPNETRAAAQSKTMKILN